MLRTSKLHIFQKYRSVHESGHKTIENILVFSFIYYCIWKHFLCFTNYFVNFEWHFHISCSASVVPLVEKPVASEQQVNATGSDSKNKPYLPIVMNITNQTVLFL